MQTEERLSTVLRKEIHLDYLMHIPTSYHSSPNEKFPLILFLHGSGERGDDVGIVKQTGLPNAVERQPDFPFIVASPQCPSTDTWTAHVDALIALMQDIASRYRIDNTRIYLTGLSLGGRGAWYLAAQTPQSFAAVVPICGRGFPELATQLTQIPVWAFHGENDTVVPVHESENMVTAINVAGGNARLTIYPNAGHDSWTQAYSDPMLYAWLLAQQKK